MAVDMFIKLEGIKGEAQDDKHKDEIDVLSWSWGLNNTGTAGVGGGGGAGKVNVQDLSFTKWHDKSSPTLIQCCATGKHISKATMIVRKAGEKPLEYIVFTLEEVLVTNVSHGGSQGEERLTENVTLNFRKFGMKYTEQTDKGGGGTSPEWKYDIAANKEL